MSILGALLLFRTWTELDPAVDQLVSFCSVDQVAPLTSLGVLEVKVTSVPGRTRERKECKSTITTRQKALVVTQLPCNDPPVPAPLSSPQATYDKSAFS